MLPLTVRDPAAAGLREFPHESKVDLLSDDRNELEHEAIRGIKIKY